ncbi:hypothetical protein Ahy_B02g059885 [Arachis hypogaea]|uniref:Ubiquitin-like protease family profile domain-containing protein n=1 Tax=Arachis hypogaea TaxID=3818 RepID=A0A445AHI6_ARAHY|nr:hypothetical protein Ahy_B02g059885 [Arachis hypogaea]
MLVLNLHCAMTRKALRTLEPGKQLVDDVLILLARMLVFDSTRLQWYLPTTFVADLLPMWCDNHWFLIVVDLSRKQLVYLDSLWSPTTKSKRQIRKFAIFMDDLLDNRAWYANADTNKMECSEFDIKEPEVVQQLPESNNCGIFVAQWMIMYHLFYDYDVETYLTCNYNELAHFPMILYELSSNAFQFVTDYSRMRLANDMVLKYHNDNRMETVEAILKYWRSFTTAP